LIEQQHPVTRVRADGTAKRRVTYRTWLTHAGPHASVSAAAGCLRADRAARPRRVSRTGIDKRETSRSERSASLSPAHWIS
jgi:hypothetical protein